MYLFFDTETTGLPKDWRAPQSDLKNWPRLVQIAWLQYDVGGTRIAERNYIIRPEGFTIPEEASRIHGISTERAMREGVDLKKVLEEFSGFIDVSGSVIAHNMDFDEKVIGAEFLRIGIKNSLMKTGRICTMKESTDYCKIPGRYGFKWPKLSELHMILFSREFEEVHDASVDIAVCAKCFWELKKRGVIDRGENKLMQRREPPEQPSSTTPFSRS
jgi:DNA polymerase III epsilon subunit-like protein